jgi:hypothetical protein
MVATSALDLRFPALPCRLQGVARAKDASAGGRFRNQRDSRHLELRQEVMEMSMSRNRSTNRIDDIAERSTGFGAGTGSRQP